MTADNKITLHAFTELVAKRAKVSSVEADTYIHQLAKTMAHGLENGDYIHLYRFGRFSTTHVDEQMGHDPNTGKPLTIAEHTRAHFHPYNSLRIAVNAPFNQLRIRELTPDKTAWRTRSGAWLLAALILVLLILLWMYGKGSGISTQDAPLVPPEIASVTTPITSAPATAPAAKMTTTLFTVSPGDTLWAIAETRWGDPFWWPVIYAENRSELPLQNPDLIDTGITLRVPVLAGSAISPTAEDLRLKTDAEQIVANDYRKLSNPRAVAYTADAAKIKKVGQ